MHTTLNLGRPKQIQRSLPVSYLLCHILDKIMVHQFPTELRIKGKCKQGNAKTALLYHHCPSEITLSVGKRQTISPLTEPYMYKLLYKLKGDSCTRKTARPIKWKDFSQHLCPLNIPWSCRHKNMTQQLSKVTFSSHVILMKAIQKCCCFSISATRGQRGKTQQ